MIHEMDSTKVSFSTYSLLNCFIVRKKMRLRSLSFNRRPRSLVAIFLELDLAPMTLVLKLDLDIVKMNVCTENEVPSFSGSKALA